MKAIVKKTIKTRNGSRKTVSEELIGSRPISKKTTISNQRPDYVAKPKTNKVTAVKRYSKGR